MMTTREYWIGSVFIAEWDLVDAATGEPVTEATVSGTVATPGQTLVPMQVAHEAGSNTWRLSYKAGAAGEHGWRASAAAGADGVVSGTFFVSRDVTGAPPITLDPATELGQIRLLTTDVDEAFPLHTDADLTAFLAMEGGSVKRAAAASLEAIGTSEVLVGKKITTQDLSTDGPAVAKDLRERAKALRDQADRADDDADDDADGFGFDAVAMPGRSPWARW
jgi:hypothetical protein